MTDTDLSCKMHEKQEKSLCTDGIIRGTIRTFCASFAKGVALVCSFFVFIWFVITALNSPSDTKYTALKVLPNHEWKTKPFSKENDTLLKISIDGPIGIGNGLRKDQMYSAIADLYNLNLKSGSLKGIILDINTPGGTVDDSDAIMRLLLETKKKLSIPIFAYVDRQCCSGGMLIALASDTITASSPSIIGSVGVILSTAFNYSSTMQRLGVHALTLHSGKDKDSLNPFRGWEENEGANHQALLDAYYQRFTSLVAEHRPKLTQKKLYELGAQVFHAEKALEFGYIDEINDSWTDFLAQTAQKTGCSNTYQLIELAPTISLPEILAGNTTVFGKNGIHHHIRIPGDIDPDAFGKALLYQK